MPTDYDEILGYDADHDDPSQYCRHGTWIGSWWGPDYLCHWCESGEEPPTAQELALIKLREQEARAARFDEMGEALRQNLGWRSDVAQCLMEYAEYFK